MTSSWHGPVWHDIASSKAMTRVLHRSDLGLQKIPPGAWYKVSLWVSLWVFNFIELYRISIIESDWVFGENLPSDTRMNRTDINLFWTQNWHPTSHIYSQVLSRSWEKSSHDIPYIHDVIWRYWTSKLLVVCILSSVCLRLSQFSVI